MWILSLIKSSRLYLSKHSKWSAFWLSYTYFVHVFGVYFSLFCSSVQEEVNFMFFPKVNGHFHFRNEGEHSLQALLCSKCPVKLSHTSAVLPHLHTLSKGKTTWKQHGSVPIKQHMGTFSAWAINLPSNWPAEIKTTPMKSICHMPKNHSQIPC